MEFEKEKATIFYTILTFGLGVILTVDVANHTTEIVLFIQAILFIAAFYSAIKIPLIYKRFRKHTNISKPKIEYKFELPQQNDLRLYIYNPKGAKNVYIECWNKDVLTIRGTRYMHEFPNELKIVRDSRGPGFPLFKGTLTSDDKREIMIGSPFDGKISLRYLGDDSPVFNFRDGTFEYVVNCRGKYLTSGFTLPDFKIWLVIKKGSLIAIKKEL